MLHFIHQLQTYNCVSLLFSAWRWWLVGLISFLCLRTAAYHLLERCACEPHQQRCSHRAKFRINGDKSVCSYCERPLSPCHGCFRVVSWYIVIAKILIAECIFRRSTLCISSVTWGFVKCKWEQWIHSYTWNNMHMERYVLNHTVRHTTSSSSSSSSHSLPLVGATEHHQKSQTWNMFHSLYHHSDEQSVT